MLMNILDIILEKRYGRELTDEQIEEDRVEAERLSGEALQAKAAAASLSPPGGSAGHRTRRRRSAPGAGP